VKLSPHPDGERFHTSIYRITAPLKPGILEEGNRLRCSLW
jgi:hypothetical protein